MNKQSGFTLIELLIVLSIWGLLISLSTPLLFNNLDKQEEKQFLKLLQSDILYIQYLATTSYDKEVHIKFNKGYYSIRDGTTKSSIKRNFPLSWKVNMRGMENISFNNKGTIRYAGTIQIETDHSTYLLVHPPGKGRGYIVKQ